MPIAIQHLLRNSADHPTVLDSHYNACTSNLISQVQLYFANQLQISGGDLTNSQGVFRFFSYLLLYYIYVYI